MKLKQLFFILVIFFLSVTNCLAVKSTPSVESDQQISGFSLAGYADKGKKSWDIAGKEAEIFADTVKLKDVEGNLYGKDEDVNLTSKTGDFNKADGKVHLEKDVVITTSKGTKLTTNSMDWDRKNEIVTTLDRVNIEKDNMNLTGIGAHGEQRLKKVALNKDVRLDINPTPPSLKAGEMSVSDKVVVTCDGPLTIDYDKNVATFNDNVRVERIDSVIYSDAMDLYFSSGKSKDVVSNKAPSLMGNNKIDRIVARGNVRIVRGENTSYSDEAVYTAIDKKIILSGRPKLVFYTTEDFKNASFGN
ncbi:MAG: LPS export ABC transporter periplasmic protein LptC [Candidatus Omnitrophica bacterium]|nr:LPS export ABC transporter periplasmic protein LptC [Candidatus Omnitrophota bacterium]